MPRKRGGREPFRPTKEELDAAYGKRVKDVIAPGLKVLFVGINPGRHSAAVGHHFAGPANRFWKALQLSGFTDRTLSPFDERDLLLYGLGVTNLVGRATATAAEIDDDEIRRGGRRVVRKARSYKPSFVAFLGLSAYRKAFARPKAPLGLQEQKIGISKVWLLPNPSGLNAHYQLPDFARIFGELRRAVD